MKCAKDLALALRSFLTPRCLLKTIWNPKSFCANGTEAFSFKHTIKLYSHRGIAGELQDKKSPTASQLGICVWLDIKIYLEALEAVDTAGFGEGVQVLFFVLYCRCEAAKKPVIT